MILTKSVIRQFSKGNTWSSFMEAIHLNHPAMLNLNSNSFIKRALGDFEEGPVLKRLGCKSLDELTKKSLPLLYEHGMVNDATLRTSLSSLAFDTGYSEHFLLSKVVPRILRLNKDPEDYSLFLGQGYYGCILPEVIKRNLLENPEWYTSYTPYQAEISQGRLQALFLYQYLITELTGMEIANASLLDEPSAAVEAISMSLSLGTKRKIWISDDVFLQTKSVLTGKASLFEVEMIFGTISSNGNLSPPLDASYSCLLVQSPNLFGTIQCHIDAIAKECQHFGVICIVAVDLLSLILSTPPHMADIVVGSSQRLGMPLGYGGPGAGFIASKMKYARKLPGRLVGESIDSIGRKAYRLSLQTREQHIRKEKATSNICTAQVLPAIVTTFYSIHHGPDGLTAIAHRIAFFSHQLWKILTSFGYVFVSGSFFDTLALRIPNMAKVVSKALAQNIALSGVNDDIILISISEITTIRDLVDLCLFFASLLERNVDPDQLANQFQGYENLDPSTSRKRSKFLQAEEFLSHQSEQAFTRFLFALGRKDISLINSMIPLGSCTMKLNSASVLAPFTNPLWNNIHPLVPLDWARGYSLIIRDLKNVLRFLTGFADITFQPASGAQAELTALSMIKKYHNHPKKNLCLIPESAHGTNFASASLAGFDIRRIACQRTTGFIDMDSLEKCISEADLDNSTDGISSCIACMMITLPSTYGIEEPHLKEICGKIHDVGGVLYLDGANLNAFLGIARPADLGIDMMHINMHKTLSIPHGGGGPGMGPLLVNQKMKDLLPTHPFESFETDSVSASSLGIEAISGAPYSSASLLIIPWMYLRCLGYYGIRKVSQHALANANYLAKELEDRGFDVLFKNSFGYVAHEFVARPKSFPAPPLTAVDVAKRLQDYGYHAPTVSWPIHDALLIEPTESESLMTIDAFAMAMGKIASEIEQREIELLKESPHSGQSETSSYVVPIGRVNEEYGDALLNNSACCPK